MTRLFEAYELDAFLGEFISEFDVDAIIDDATYIKGGKRYWKNGIDINDICKKHERECHAEN